MSASAQDYECKTITGDWQWFSDHAAVWIDYVVVGAPGRKYEVGTGMFINGSPWGSKVSKEGSAEIRAFGAGALHIRQADSGPPFKICATSKDIKPITIINTEF